MPANNRTIISSTSGVVELVCVSTWWDDLLFLLIVVIIIIIIICQLVAHSFIYLLVSSFFHPSSIVVRWFIFCANCFCRHSLEPYDCNNNNHDLLSSCLWFPQASSEASCGSVGSADEIIAPNDNYIICFVVVITRHCSYIPQTHCLFSVLSNWRRLINLLMLEFFATTCCRPVLSLDALRFARVLITDWHQPKSLDCMSWCKQQQQRQKWKQEKEDKKSCIMLAPLSILLLLLPFLWQSFFPNESWRKREHESWSKWFAFSVCLCQFVCLIVPFGFNLAWFVSD